MYGRWFLYQIPTTTHPATSARAPKDVATAIAVDLLLLLELLGGTPSVEVGCTPMDVAVPVPAPVPLP